MLALSVLGLLALCCLPAFAQASAEGIEYGNAPASATGKPPSESNLQNGSSSTSGVGSKSGKANSSGSRSGGGKNNSSSQSGKNSYNSGGKVSQGDGQEGSLGAGSAEPGSDSGGSSPLVPILIAIVLLAAGSIAFVMIRRRRAANGKGTPGSSGPSSSSGSPVSPEVG